MTLTIGIYLFDEVELLDFAGPYEVFTTASRVFRRANPDAAPLLTVRAVSHSHAAVRARAGLLLQPDCDFADHPPFDVLIVPGGVVTAELARPGVADWIKACAGKTRITASVCTGAFLLAQAGLFAGKSATTHWEDVEDLRAMFPGLSVLSGRRWVDEGAVVSSAGISAGIDMSLHLVEVLAGRELALGTARQMEYDWAEDSALET